MKCVNGYNKAIETAGLFFFYQIVHLYTSQPLGEPREFVHADH